MADPARDEPGRRPMSPSVWQRPRSAGLAAGRVVTSPARLLARSFLLELIVRDAADGLADSGRRAEARARRRAEEAAAEILGALETVRGGRPRPRRPGPRCAHRTSRSNGSPASCSRARRSSASCGRPQRAGLHRTWSRTRSRATSYSARSRRSSPAQVSAMRSAARRARSGTTWSSRSAPRPAGSTTGSSCSCAACSAGPVGIVRRLGGFTGRLAAFTVDATITHLGLLVGASLVGLLGWLLGLSAPGWIAAVLPAPAGRS